MSHAMEVLRGIEGLSFVELGVEDVVRHRLVRDIVRAYEGDEAAPPPSPASGEGR
jgi:phosphate starvation-inducible PhoH-like protein